MKDKVAISASFCPRYHHAIELIGRRWTGAILREIYGGTHRFSDIAASVPGLSDRLLSERLKELEVEGIVTRTVYPDTPVRIEYCLTEKGQDLGRVMDEIATWASRWLDEFPPEACDHLAVAIQSTDSL
ncbi:MAG: helix-turn-helix transcriptional regulator [Thermomicrobiales bacterium]|jgi:DNA-binding HxlR family transcriptional regulator|nr:helix-turn-helix transcriptional regulator [Thermomicrobiales bacterium]